MKHLFYIIFALALAISGCTIDSGSATLDVEAEITNIGNTILSVKYYIGDTVLFDDLIMTKNTGIFEMIKAEKMKTIPLTVHIYVNHSEDTSFNKGTIKYYYGANLLAESQSFDFESILLIAKKHTGYFEWEYLDGKSFGTNKKAPEIKSEAKKTVPLDQIKEESSKL